MASKRQSKAKQAPKRAVAPPLADASTGTELAARVLAAPDDGGARLVYADWLEQHGDLETAAFLRGGGRLVTLADAERHLEAVLVELHARNQRAERVYKMRPMDLETYYPATHPILRSPQIGVWLQATLARIAIVQTQYRGRGATTPAYLGDGYDTRPFTDATAHLKTIASQLIRRAKPALAEAEVVSLLELMSRGESLLGLRHLLPWAGMTGLVERHVETHGLSPAVRAAIERVRAEFLRKPGVVLGKDDLQIRKRLEALLG